MCACHTVVGVRQSLLCPLLRSQPEMSKLIQELKDMVENKHKPKSSSAKGTTGVCVCVCVHVHVCCVRTCMCAVCACMCAVYAYTEVLYRPTFLVNWGGGPDIFPYLLPLCSAILSRVFLSAELLTYVRSGSRECRPYLGRTYALSAAVVHLIMHEEVVSRGCAGTQVCVQLWLACHTAALSIYVSYNWKHILLNVHA